MTEGYVMRDRWSRLVTPTPVMACVVLFFPVITTNIELALSIIVAGDALDTITPFSRHARPGAASNAHTRRHPA